MKLRWTVLAAAAVFGMSLACGSGGSTEEPGMEDDPGTEDAGAKAKKAKGGAKAKGKSKGGKSKGKSKGGKSKGKK